MSQFENSLLVLRAGTLWQEATTAAFLDAMSDGTLPPTLGSAARKPPSRLLREGFRNVYNPKGGIDAWSLSIDPSVPRY